MDHATQVELIRRLLGYQEAGTTHMEAREVFNAVHHYLDPRQLERERDVLFRRYPIAIGFASQVRNPGDFFTHEDTGVPILAVRDRAGTLRAFVNVCRHRGTQLASEPCGSGKKAFVCPYHGWSYDADGHLLGIVHEEGFPGIDREQYHLVPLPVTERFGLVWVRPTPNGAPIDLDGALGKFAAEMDGFGLDTWVPYRTKAIRKRMNWKLMFDTFMEFYHFRWAHRDSIYPRFTDNLITYEEHREHLRLVGATRSIADLKGKPEAEWNLIDHSVIVYGIFPHIVLASLGDHFNVFSMFPGERVDEAVCYLTIFIPEEPRTDSARKHWEMNYDLAIRTVEGEDFVIGEGIQRGLASGANSHLTYGRFEPGLHGFHRAINAALDRRM